jgi:hypothetical protein
MKGVHHMDGSAPGASAPNPTQVELCDEIGRAVGALWQRRSGVRPSNVSTEYVGDIVRCTIDEGKATGEADSDDELLGERRYENEAQAAVRRLTGRTVMGFTQKRVKDSARISNAFILQRAVTKY